MQLNLPRPINPNNALNAMHAVFVATTGGGKTTAVKKLRLPTKENFLPTSGDHVLFFDPYNDYEGNFRGRPVKVCRSWAEFYAAAVKARASKTGFKISITDIKATPENFEIFCQIAWSLGDGKKKPLYCICEENAKCAPSSGKANGAFGECMTGGRKFGLRMFTMFQRGQEVSKTALTQSPFKWIGSQETPRDVNYIANEVGIPLEVVAGLRSARDNEGEAQYVIKYPGRNEPQPGEMKCF